MARPKIHDETLRTRLLDAAGQLLSEEGPHALSLRRLAGDAGTSTTAVYSLFGGKPELLDALYREAFRRLGARLAAAGQTDDALADLARIGAAYRASALADPHLYGVMFGRPIPGLEPDDEAKAESAASIEPLLDIVRRLVDTGIFVDLPVETIGLGLWATAHGLVSLELNGVMPAGLDPGANYQTVLDAAVRSWFRTAPTEVTPSRTAGRPRRRARAR